MNKRSSALRPRTELEIVKLEVERSKDDNQRRSHLEHA